MKHPSRLALLILLAASSLVQPASQATAQIANSTPLPPAVRAARNAVVRIESVGAYRPTFVVESEEGFGSGTGFIVDAEGRTVTNAHVVHDDGTLTAFLDGSIEPIEADVLGIAECADLALLDLKGEGYPFLTWGPESAKRGDAIFALGYPGSAFDTVTTRGVVRSVAADNPTEWASIETAIRHTAEVAPGNSGGPLLNSAGQVVGVTYAEAVFVNRGYAIAAADVLPLLDRLAAGERVASIGVSGEAFYEDSALNGFWVASVQEGSPAAAAGVLPGDILRELDGAPVSIDGTMGSFCQILRDADPGMPLPVEVLRPDNAILLRGELYGSPLAAVETLAEVVLPTPQAVPTPTPAPTPRPDQFQTRTDATGTIALQVPEDWRYVASDPEQLGSVLLAPQMVLALDERSYRSGRATPSVLAWVDPIESGEPGGDLTSEPLDEIPCAVSALGQFNAREWNGQVRTWSECKEPGDPLYLAASLAPKSGEPVRVSLLLYIPSGEPRFTLETLVAPLADALLPRVPFWEPPRATVLATQLNVRSGPGLDYAVLTTLGSGEEIPVIAKDTEACEWVYFFFSNLQGWANASPEYLRLDRDCGSLAVMDDETLQQLREIAK